MITDILIELVVKVLGPFLNSFLPSISLGSTVTRVLTGALDVGQLLRLASIIVPIGVLTAWLTVFFAVLPLIGAYIVAQWVWDHVPMILGFGTG